METDLNGTAEAAKRQQQLGGLRSGAGFSAWTPLSNKRSNAQLFEERVNLALHWFDLWTDRQRKHLLGSLLARCAKTQLTYCRDLLKEAVPATRADFTAVLPRFLSLYVLSFLSPRDLSSAAQVSWHWRVLAEQDCIWASRCLRRGWFLPYAPAEREYGAWKNHYVACVATLDWLTPREAAERYGTSSRWSPAEEEEEKERRRREMIREALREEKRLSMRTRKAWGGASRQVRGGITSDSWPSLSRRPNAVWSSGLRLTSAEGEPASTSFRPIKACEALSPFTHSPARQHAAVQPARLHAADLLLLISDRVPAYELVLSGAKAGVTAIVYDHRGTLAALLAQVERAASGRRARRLGLLAPGGTEEVRLLQSHALSERTVLDPDHRGFWEKLGGRVAPADDGGGIDIFSPLAGSASGVALIQTLATLTGVEVWAPMGFATGSFQNILSEWSNGVACAGPADPRPAAPALRYVTEAVLEGWCRQAGWMEEALAELRARPGPQLRRAGLQARGRALGHCLWEEIRLEELPACGDLSEALIEGLAALAGQEETRPLEFLAAFLARWAEAKERGGSRPEAPPCNSQTLPAELPQAALDWRGVAARELHHSEELYVGRLAAVLKVYQEPLAAALNSHRAILSHGDIQVILRPVAHILQLNRAFLGDLEARLQQWGAEQCVGDVLLKLCAGLRVYGNYLNNYATALATIDKCRETKPAFRAFLKRADRTLATHMLSLQELLTCPAWRIQEYVTLLQALSLHTPPGHPDRAHVSSALDALQRYGGFVQKLKRNSEPDGLLEDAQRLIRGCPGRKQAADNHSGRRSAQESRRTDSGLAQDLRARVGRGPLPVQRRPGADAARPAPRAVHAGPPEHARLPGVRGPLQPRRQRDHAHALYSPRLRPGRPQPVVGLRHGEGRGEGSLPVRAAFGHRRRPDAAALTPRQ